jgi:hypothetical protein
MKRRIFRNKHQAQFLCVFARPVAASPSASAEYPGEQPYHYDHDANNQYDAGPNSGFENITNDFATRKAKRQKQGQQ